MQLQKEIMMQKAAKERFEIAMQLTDDYKRNIENDIKEENPQISIGDLKIEVFRGFYKNDFSEEKMEDIVQGFREYHSKLIC